MFSLIRGAIIVGLIVYFSPVRDVPERDLGEPERQSAGTRPRASADPSPARERSDEQDRMMGRLVGSLAEEAVRTAMGDKAQAGLRLKEQVASHLVQPSPKTAAAVVLRGSDRGSPGPAERCVYRCDGAE